MTSKEWPGAWYTDALPNGNYVATWRDGRIESNGSAVPPPPNGAILPLYVRLRNTAVVQFTGQEWQASDRALTWNQLNGWTVDDRVASRHASTTTTAPCTSTSAARWGRRAGAMSVRITRWSRAMRPIAPRLNGLFGSGLNWNRIWSLDKAQTGAVWSGTADRCDI